MAKQQYRDGSPQQEESTPQLDRINTSQQFYEAQASLDQIRQIQAHGAHHLSAKQLSEFVRTVDRSLPPVPERTMREDNGHDETITSLAKSLKNNKLVLVLGAGVSMGFGLPDWPTLLQKLMITTIEREAEESAVLSQLFSALFEPSAVVAGRYLQSYYEDKDASFEEAVRKILYANLDIKAPSPLMEKIVHLCVAPGRSPTLDSIITYNFDDLLEQRLELLNIDLPYKAIYADGMHPGNNRLPIYHVHGYLPSQGDISDRNRITLGETVYHKQYTDIYSWNNIIQINKFTDFNCLFIGTSLTDPNTRRLLDVAYRQRGERDEFHYVFKRRVRHAEIQARLERILQSDRNMMATKSAAELPLDKTVDYLITIIERFEESDTESFGVKTIWIDDFADIPEMLEKIREQAL